MSLRNEWKKRLKEMPDLAGDHLEAIQNCPDDTSRFHMVYVLICEQLGQNVKDFDFNSITREDVDGLFL